MYKTLILSCLLLFSLLGPPPQARAQSEEQFMSLEASIQYALENNKQVENARFDEYIARSSVREVLAIGLPQIRGSADLQYFVELPTQILPAEFSPQQEIVFIEGKPYPLTKLDPETFEPVYGDALEVQFGFPWQSTIGIQAQQLVADGTYFLGLKASRTFVDLSQKSTQLTREEIAYNVTKAYYGALVAQEQQKLLEVNLNRVRKLFEETKILNESGFVEKIDVDRLQINYTNLQLELEKIKRYVELSKDLLKFQMGMPVDQSVLLTENVQSLMGETPSLEEMLSFSPQNRFEFSLLETQMELENYNLKRHKVGYLPSLYAFGSYQFNAQRNEFNLFSADESWFPISVVGLQLNVPIFDGLAGKERVQQSRIKLKQLENQRIMLENSVLLEMRKASGDLLNAQNTLRVAEKNAELAQKVFDVSQIKYKEGVGSSLEVNDAESTLQESEAKLLSATFEYLIAKADLDKAKGEFSRYHSTTFENE
jgi:outer membrane protein